MKKLYLKPSAEVQSIEMGELIASSPALRYWKSDTTDNSFEALSKPFRSPFEPST